MVCKIARGKGFAVCLDTQKGLDKWIICVSRVFFTLCRV